MTSSHTVRELAVALPEVEDRSEGDELGFAVRGKAFAWTLLERDSTSARTARPDVLAIRCTADDKEALLASDSGKFYVTAHYNGFPAVLVRLNKVGRAELRELLSEAWRCQAPKSLARQLEE